MLNTTIKVSNLETKHRTEMHHSPNFRATNTKQAKPGPFERPQISRKVTKSTVEPKASLGLSDTNIFDMPMGSET